MKYYCNPINVNYRYQVITAPDHPELSVAREAADPSLLKYKGKYYIFASMTLGVWMSDDLVTWENHPLPSDLPLYDYAPDVRVVGDYVYFSASNWSHNCDFYRTKDVLNGPYERIEGSFPFWDPNLFADADGRIYFYWGCNNSTPIWGVELDAQTMKPIGEPKALFYGDPYHNGYERFGENHSLSPRTDEEVEACYQEFLRTSEFTEDQIPEDKRRMIKAVYRNMPYIEGAWMDRFGDRYYLQYAGPGTEFNIYADGVYVSDHPLGPFVLAKNNPYSYKPGGFITGAGHGSTLADQKGRLWHASTMHISVNHKFERRVGIWPAGIDADGELFCNQRYGDWPMAVPEDAMDPWQNPKWYLLSYHKDVTASSFTKGHEPALAVDENVQTWWKAATNQPGEWILVDLGTCRDVHAIQINFADDHIAYPRPKHFVDGQENRYIVAQNLVTRWYLEGSTDGTHFEMIEDKSNANTDLPHDLVVIEAGKPYRYLKLTVLETPFRQSACLSGLRVFGKGEGNAPKTPVFEAVRTGDLDMHVSIKPQEDAVGYNILWGSSPDKLYHSDMIFGTEQNIGALVLGERYCVRVDAFNENGITESNIQWI